MTKRFYLISLITLVSICNGCGKSKHEKAYDLAIEGLKSAISSGLRPEEKKAFPEGHHFDIEYRVPRYQAALNFLEGAGPQAMKKPMTLLSYLAPADPNIPDLQYSHILFLEWFCVKSRATGFYFVMKDGATQEFNNALAQDNIFPLFHLQEGSARSAMMLFTHAQNLPAGELVRWPSGLFEQVITKQEVQGVGLIFENGTKAEARPMGYKL